MTAFEKSPVLGLRENARAFWLLVLVNAFVGGMVGVERSLFSILAVEEFGTESVSQILYFIIAFGLAKAIANYYAGKWSQSVGRKRVLMAGWLLALPIPAIVYFAPSWNWVIASQVLLGFSQGLAWSSTVIMKIDLVGPRNRGLAMGINEFAGYLAVGIMAFVAAELSVAWGYVLAPVLLSAVLAILGLMLSWGWVRDTSKFVQLEDDLNSTKAQPIRRSAIEQAGLVNNFNDGLIWGVLPLFLLSLDMNNAQLGLITGLYPAIWGLGQLFTGALGDRWSKRWLITAGMTLQGLGLMSANFAHSFWQWGAFSVLMGLGTALVYPNFIAAIADSVRPASRAAAVGRFRFWRDLGYPVGALLSGWMSDSFGFSAAFLWIGVLTLLSGIWVGWRWYHFK